MAAKNLPGKIFTNPTPPPESNNNRVATTAFVKTAIENQFGDFLDVEDIGVTVQGYDPDYTTVKSTVTANTLARHDAVTVTDSAEIDFTLTGQNITASIVAGSIVETKLGAGVNASLDLADTALQPGSAQASEIVVDTTGFVNNLGATDNTVQAALQTLDGLVATGSSTGSLSEIIRLSWFA